MDVLYLNIDRHDDHELKHGYSPALDLVLASLAACMYVVSTMDLCCGFTDCGFIYVLTLSWWTRLVADLLGWLVWVMSWPWTCVVCVVFAVVW